MLVVHVFPTGKHVAEEEDGLGLQATGDVPVTLQVELKEELARRGKPGRVFPEIAWGTDLRILHVGDR